MVLIGCLHVHAKDQPCFHEYQVKAALLYNFSKFVDWPETSFQNAAAPIIIGILGNDPFGNHLDRTIKNKTVNGRSLTIHRFKKLDDLTPCHILFISPSEKKHLSEVLDKLKTWHVLTVSDMKNFSRSGGMINLITEVNRIRFEINIDAADQGGLKISSQLLKLSKIVRTNHQEMEK